MLNYSKFQPVSLWKIMPERHGQTNLRTDRQTDRRHTVALPRSA